MKIVLQYDVGGGYECGTYTYVDCITYESTEAAICNFEEAIKDCMKNRKFFFDFFGNEYALDSFVYKGKIELPIIMELNEWFQAKIEGRI